MKMKMNNILCFLSVLLALLLVSAAVDTSADKKDVKKQEVKAAPVEDAKDEGGGGDWGRGCGRRCRYGCCGGSDNCGCRRCCAPNEYAMVKEPGKVEDTKSGGGGDHGCRPCCFRGGCRCCAENEVPIDNNNNNKP